MQINEKIFRAYDVRGVYPSEINERVVYNSAAAFLSCLNKEKARIALGRDLRQSSNPLAESLRQALLDFGCEVIDLGVVTTPMLYFAVGFLKLDGGAMITASHNPLNYNGVKFTKRGSEPISGKEIKNFYLENVRPNGTKRGRLVKKDISDDYIKQVLKGFKITRNIKLKIKKETSAADLFLPKFLKQTGVELVSSGEDLSVSFDFDADRLYVYDEKGEKIRGDIVGGIIADSFLKKGDKAIADVVSTRFLEVFFRAKGIEIIRSPVGHFFIKEAMRNNSAVFALEISGHYYFKSLYYCDSAFLALRFLLEALDKNADKKISDLAKVFQKYFHSGEINLPLKNKEEWAVILAKLKEVYKDSRQSLEDGISAVYFDPVDGELGWWFNLRPSNTEPVMRLVVEAKTKKLMEEKKKELVRVIHS